MDNSWNNNPHLADDIEDDPKSNDFTQQLLHLRKILANSSFFIDEIFSKTTNGNDFLPEDFLSDYSKPYQTNFYSEILCKDEDGRISLAYERLPGIPRKIADKFAQKTHTIDLSYNNIKDLAFLSNFKILHTLILDNNVSLNERTLPFLPSLRILWLNKCEISHLPKWMHQISICTPNIRQLSLMGNPGVRSTFNGGTSLDNNEYIMYVTGFLPNLDYLDDIKITADQRIRATAPTNVYMMNHSLRNFAEHSMSVPNMRSISKYDAKMDIHMRKHQNGLPIHALKRSGSRFNRF